MNGKKFFLDVDTVQSPDLEFFTDAASSSGYDAYYKGSWFSVPWQPHQLKYAMSTMELYPIVVASFVCGSHWANKRILLHCDNEGTVAIINKGYSSTEPIANLLRNLTCKSMQHNFHLKAVHIPGKYNIKADLLSRFQIQKFLQIAPEATSHPTQLPALVMNLAES